MTDPPTVPDHRARALAETAWRHLVNRHALAQALDELPDPNDPHQVDLAAQQLATGPTPGGPRPSEHHPLTQGHRHP